MGNEGLTQDEPLLATAITPAGEQIFCEVPPRSWYDPPTTYGFEFEALDGTLFTDILDFPVGEDDRLRWKWGISLWASSGQETALILSSSLARGCRFSASPISIRW